MKKILLAMLVLSASVAAQAKVLVSLNDSAPQVLEYTKMEIAGGVTIYTKTEKYQITQSSLEQTNVSAKELTDLITKYSNSKTNVELDFVGDFASGRFLVGLAGVSFKK